MQSEKQNEQTTGLSLEEAINTSKAKLEALKEESAPKLSETDKRGRGRPKGTFKIKPQSRPVMGADLPQGSAPVNPQVIPQLDITPLASEAVKIPFDFAGSNYGLDLTPTDAEAQTPARYLSQLIESYFPNLNQKDPKTFNLVAFLISYGLLIAKKARLIIEFKKNKNQENKNNKSEENNQDTRPTPQMRPLPKETVSATDYFSNGGI